MFHFGLAAGTPQGQTTVGQEQPSAVSAQLLQLQEV